MAITGKYHQTSPNIMVMDFSIAILVYGIRIYTIPIPAFLPVSGKINSWWGFLARNEMSCTADQLFVRRVGWSAAMPKAISSPCINTMDGNFATNCFPAVLNHHAVLIWSTFVWNNVSSHIFMWMCLLITSQYITYHPNLRTKPIGRPWIFYFWEIPS